MTTSPRPRLAVSLAVFREDGRVLIARRGWPPADGLWSLPGGRVEWGETLEAAALRELMEEVGVEAAIIGFNRHVEVIRPDEGLHFVVASFVGRWIAGEAQTSTEAAEVRWIADGGQEGLATTAQLGDVLNSARAIWEATR